MSINKTYTSGKSILLRRYIKKNIITKNKQNLCMYLRLIVSCFVTASFNGFFIALLPADCRIKADKTEIAKKTHLLTKSITFKSVAILPRHVHFY